ncbi:2-oxoacid:ferredoxin oxidoreductase subunit gamma [Siculibacillus lacustris]|uniref:2-oxoacid:ferredoxin oxidoreductase subunit gamma n=1 Tax=Siculibacillus lacustris TaxID=1549641 RepID=A0A4Q9VUZ4_9HYPH|nr:2-oxoacid:acceptor oxidoreductase family protein [Siculibacillus lacustris]TBW38993.1 2-oxoacid:ferredoxin oxidoreductase subunit gamma [Siculibacillus lacustris]
MENSLLVGGFGGQGVVLIGQLLGYSATEADLHATFFASYGAEMRGGTANCTVLISDDEIGSPVVSEVDTVIALNEPSLARFESWVKPGGTIIVNSSMVTRAVGRNDVKAVYVAANDIAHDLGNDKAANMVILGSYIGATHALDPATVIRTMRAKMAAKAPFLASNEAAIRAGFALADHPVREAAE